MITGVQAAFSSGPYWARAVKDACSQLAPFSPNANFGFVYVTDALAGDLGSIVTFLRETTPIANWAGGCCSSLLPPPKKGMGKLTLALMLGQAPPESVRLFEGPPAHDPEPFIRRHKDWLSRQQGVSALLHVNPNAFDVEERIALLTRIGPIFAFGAALAPKEQAAYVAGGVRRSGLSGMFFGDGAELIIGHAQSCRPISGRRKVTNAAGNVIMELDNELALKALRNDAASFMGTDLRQAAGSVHIAVPDPSTDDQRAFYVRELEAIDPTRGWLAVRGAIDKGEQIMFVRRDEADAAINLRRMAEKMKERLEGRTIQGGLFISSIVRDAYLFGGQSVEQKIISECLGVFPMIGISGKGEIRRDLLYGQSSVLALFV